MNQQESRRTHIVSQPLEKAGVGGGDNCVGRGAHEIDRDILPQQASPAVVITRLVQEFIDRAARAKEIAWSSASRLARVPNQYTIDEDFFDASGEREWVRKSRPIDHRVRIKEDEISESAFANHPAILPIEALCGQGSHLADCFWQREPVFLAYEKAENAGKGASSHGDGQS